MYRHFKFDIKKHESISGGSKNLLMRRMYNTMVSMVPMNAIRGGEGSDEESSDDIGGDYEEYDVIPDIDSDQEQEFVDTDSIMKASVRGDRKAIRRFLEMKADVNAQDFYVEMTPLEVAIDHDNVKTVRLLLEAKADVHTSSIVSSEPIRMVNSGEMVSLLLDAKAHVDGNPMGVYGNTPLHTLSGLRNPTTREVDAVQALSMGKADVNLHNGFNDTPLNTSVRGDNRITKMLIEAKADINDRTGNGFTPLMTGCAYHNNNSLQLLINAKADLNAQSVFRTTALDEAIRSRACDAASTLLQAKADPNGSGRHPVPLYASAQHEDTDCTRLLLEAKAWLDPQTMQVGDPDVLQFIKSVEEHRHGDHTNRKRPRS